MANQCLTGKPTLPPLRRTIKCHVKLRLEISIDVHKRLANDIQCIQSISSVKPNRKKKYKKEFVSTYEADLLPHESNEEKYFILIKCGSIIMSPNSLQTYDLAWRKMYNSYYFSYRTNIHERSQHAYSRNVKSDPLDSMLSYKNERQYCFTAWTLFIIPSNNSCWC